MTYRSLTSLKRHRDVKNSCLTTSERHHDVIFFWQKQARSHATKTGVHHLKNGVHHFYTFQKCTVWTNEKSSIFRLYNKYHSNKTFLECSEVPGVGMFKVS